MGYIDDNLDLAMSDTDGDEVPRGYVRSLQRDLTALGFDTLGQDGDFGRNTREAARAFQQAARTPLRRVAGGLVQRVPVTFDGSDSGVVDVATRREILHWQAEGYTRAPPTPPPWTGPEDAASTAVPFADPTGSFWPVRTGLARGRQVAYRGPTGKYDPWSRRFLAPRGGGTRYHVGVDLFGAERDMVVACESGTIVAWYHFYRGVYALLVQHDSGIVINYGEVARHSLQLHGLRVGDRVDPGQPIAVVGKMRVSSMLHFETYAQGTTANRRWSTSAAAPPGLLDPTRYLLALAHQGQ